MRLAEFKMRLSALCLCNRKDTPRVKPPGTKLPTCDRDAKEFSASGKQTKAALNMIQGERVHPKLAAELGSIVQCLKFVPDVPGSRNRIQGLHFARKQCGLISES